MARKLPKRTCCTSKPRCKRCPLRMLAENRLPAGYTVKRRRLVKLKGQAKVRGKAGKHQRPASRGTA